MQTSHDDSTPEGAETESFIPKENPVTINYHKAKKTTLYDSIRSRVVICLLLVSCVLSVLAFGAGWETSLLRHDHPRHHVTNTCGGSIEDATAKGCSFDPMSFSWLPPDCYDQELIDQFLQLRDWTWYINDNGTQAARKEDVLAGKYDHLYVTDAYHQFHCTYMWRKLHRAVLRDGLVDSYIGSYKHTAHCEMILTSGDAIDNVDTVIRTKFVTCSQIF